MRKNTDSTMKRKKNLLDSMETLSSSYNGASEIRMESQPSLIS